MLVTFRMSVGGVLMCSGPLCPSSPFKSSCLCVSLLKLLEPLLQGACQWPITHFKTLQNNIIILLDPIGSLYIGYILCVSAPFLNSHSCNTGLADLPGQTQQPQQTEEEEERRRKNPYNYKNNINNTTTNNINNELPWIVMNCHKLSYIFKSVCGLSKKSSVIMNCHEWSWIVIRFMNCNGL